MARGGCGISERKSGHWIIIVGAVALILAGILIGQSGTVQEYTAPDGSSYSVTERGLSIAYRLLDERGQALQWERRPARLPSNVDRLVLWRPVLMAPEDWDDLLSWVATGRTLVIFTSDDDPEWTARLPGWIMEELDASTAAPASVSPLTAGIPAVETRGGGFRSLSQTGTIQLIDRSGAPMLVTVPHGQGQIHWSADSAWLQNEKIASGHNASMAMALLTPAAGMKTAFDEYHHGYRAAESWIEILRGPLRWFLLHLLIAAAFLFWAYGARFGQPVPVPLGSQRAAIEYVISMSQLFRRAKARGIAARSLYQSLRVALGRRIGGARGLTHAELAARVGHTAGVTPAAIESLLNELDPNAPQPPTEANLVRLAREAEALQRRVRNARATNHPGAN